MKEKTAWLVRQLPPFRPHEWWMWLYWIGAGAAAVKLGYDRWPWFSPNRNKNKQNPPLDTP
jgi:hypothetical protein